MKHIKDIRIFEKRTIRRAPMPIGDFLFDKFFGFSDAKIEDKHHNRSYHEEELYVIDISFRKEFKKVRIESFIELLDYVKKFDSLYPFINMKLWLSDKVVTNSSFSFDTSLRSEEDYIKIKNLIDAGIIVLKKSKNAIPEGRYYIHIHLAFTLSSIDEMKQSQDYIDWWNSIKDQYEDFETRKMAKKYNL